MIVEILESSDYYQLQKHPTSKTLLVICSSLDTRRPNFTFWKLAQKLECNCLFLNSPMTHWYRTGVIGIDNGIDGVSEKISNIKKQLEIERLLFFGVSMGGYGAILFGSLSKADHIIAFSVEPLLGMPGGRTEVTRNYLQPIYPDLRVLDIPKLTIVYGEMDVSDTIGAYLLNEACKNINVYHIPYAEHDVANSLNYRGELLPLLQDLIYNNEINNQSLVKGVVPKKIYNIIIRINNDYLNHKWEEVLSHLNKHADLLNQSLFLTFAYASCKYRLGDYKTSKSYLLALLSKGRECPHAWGLLSSCELRLKNYQQAIYASNIAAQLKPVYSLFHATKCNALLKVEQYEEAYNELKISGLLNPRHKQYIDELNKLETLLGYNKSTSNSLIDEKNKINEKEFIRQLNTTFNNKDASDFDLSAFNQ